MIETFNIFSSTFVILLSAEISHKHKICLLTKLIVGIRRRRVVVVVVVARFFSVGRCKLYYCSLCNLIPMDLQCASFTITAVQIFKLSAR